MGVQNAYKVDMFYAFFWVNPWRLNFICRCFGTLCLLYDFFWVIPRRMNFICRRFGALFLFHLYRQVGVHLLAYKDGTECSETSAYKIQTPGIYPEEIQHTEHGESLKSRTIKMQLYRLIYYS